MRYFRFIIPAIFLIWISSCYKVMEVPLYSGAVFELSVSPEMQEFIYDSRDTKDRWEHYRESIFKLDALLAPARYYTDFLKRSGAIERENLRWESVDIDMDYELLYFAQWTQRRLEYLDLVFD